MNYLQKENNRHILVVDDEDDVLDFLRIFLESLGWVVTVVNSVNIAFTKLENKSFFLVLTDIAMPEMDGYEFISKIRELKIPCQTALMTGFGYNPKHTLVKINKTMKCPFFFKPFDRNKVAEGIASAWVSYHKDLQGITTAI